MDTRVGRVNTSSTAGASSGKTPSGAVTKWEKKWVTFGHLKLFKWVPGGKGSGLNRPFNDNAPITRSITSNNKMVKAALITPQPTRRNPEREARATLPIVEPDENDDSPPPTPPPVTPPLNTKTPPPPATPASPPFPAEDKKHQDQQGAIPTTNELEFEGESDEDES